MKKLESRDATWNGFIPSRYAGSFFEAVSRSCFLLGLQSFHRRTLTGGALFQFEINKGEAGRRSWMRF